MVERSILIIEPEADLVAALSYNFRRSGVCEKVVHAKSCTEALEQITGVPPNQYVAVLMEPVGMEHSKVRELASHPNVRGSPLTFLSTGSEEYLAQYGVEPSLYMRKPFSVETLVNSFKAIL